ncbi:ribonuclease Z [Clostridium niameyense]|uniref:ribonuclease Z n=1 Tax=Clostridium niameyense TaxID=1622073 RepID=UPI00067EE8E8|nr:ribonuclease Z [Clostridium niameyense]
MVDVCFLGTGGSLPMPNRFLSSSLLSFLGRKILIDVGEGTQVAIRSVKSGFKSIDIICITHCHGDHVIGLSGLLSTIGNSDRTEPLTIIGPKGIKDVVSGLNIINPYLPYKLNIIENPEKVFLKITKDNSVVVHNENISNIVISTIELEHSTSCIGYSFYYKRLPKFDVKKALENNVPKILWNKLQRGEVVEFEGNPYAPYMVLGEEREGIKISYITDTRPIESIKSFIKHSSLFICEGTYGSYEYMEKALKNKHMTFEEAANLAKESNVDKLILTHFSPSMVEPKDFVKNATDIFENSYIAHDGMNTTLNYILEFNNHE